MKIKILAKHIRKGKQGDNSYCPIALAIKEEYKIDYVVVFWSRAYIGNEMYHLPRKAIKFINDFDKKKSSVKPFEFIL